MGHGAKTYEWLMEQIGEMRLREKEEWNIGVHESTLNQRARQARLGGGGAMTTEEMPAAKPLRQK
eukprot:2225557-Pyramimonas_sp.AAC.1